MSKWVQDLFGDLIIEQPKSKIKVDNAYIGEQYPFFTSGEKILSYMNPIVGGNNLYFATGGKANVKYYDGPCSYSTDTWAVTSKKVDNKFLYYWCLSHLEKMDFLYFSGSGLKHLQKKDFKRDIVYYPEQLNEQAKIAEVLSTLDDVIEKTKAIIEKYHKIKAGLLCRLLTNGIDENGEIRSPETHRYKQSPLGFIPERWDCKSLQDICKQMIRGPFGGSLKKEEFVDEGYKVYEQGNAIYKTSEKGTYFITCKRYVEMNRFAVQENDFILSCSGTIGEIYQIQKNDPAGIINQALLLFRVNNNVMTDAFFKNYFATEEFRKTIIDSTQGGAMKNIVGMPLLRKIFMRCPDISEQKRITKFLDGIEISINKETVFLQKLQYQKYALMQDLLTHKVSVDALL